MTVEEVMRGVSDADLGRPAIQCMRIFELLPGFFGTLREECLSIYRCQIPSEVGDPKHITNWVRPQGNVLQFSLLNATGRYDDTSTDHNQSCKGKHFHDADKYPVLASFLSAFPHCINFRLNVLGPKAILPAHKEHVCFRARNGIVGLRLRFHLPIATNEAAEVILDDNVYHFPERLIVLFNQGCVHGARNRGDTDRLHLVWDALLTAATAELMFGQGPAPFPSVRCTPAVPNFSPIGSELPGQFVRLDPLVCSSEVVKVKLVQPQ